MPSQTQPRGQSRPSRSAPATKTSPFAAFLRVTRMMPSTFNIIRASVYYDSELFRPHIVIMLALFAFSLRKNMNPISTRIELACLGLAGTFWLAALGAYLASSDSETANVECFASEAETQPVDDGFSTETYQAQYRVLEAFSLFNVVLVLGFLLFLFTLALRQYLMGRKQVWLTPVTTYNWFSPSPKQSKQLPPPVTARGVHRGRSTSKPPTGSPPNVKRSHSEKEKRGGVSRENSSRSNQTYYVSMPARTQKEPASKPVRAHTTTREKTTDRYKPDYYRRDASPRR
ncbi:hypothetical protein EWM64_g5163 [Hericium alpestre]|uniref:MARVEL domain-containing protein n=1 Tax=Hericium alpestre TaxID=135208 RepID=A0A4Y9ZZH6_9AGAM|nr:hypothetical protein EWM64_g5163 [Hericium alpestre]